MCIAYMAMVRIVCDAYMNKAVPVLQELSKHHEEMVMVFSTLVMNGYICQVVSNYQIGIKE